LKRLGWGEKSKGQAKDANKKNETKDKKRILKGVKKTTTKIVVKHQKRK